MARQRLVDPMATVDAVSRKALGVRTQAEAEATAGTLERYRDTDEARREAPVVTGSTADGTALLALIRALRDRGLIVDGTDTVEDEAALASLVTDALDARSVRVTGLLQVDITDAVTTLTGNVNASTTSIPVADGTRVTAGTFIRVDDEPIYVSSISGNTLTVVRSPTKNASHTSGADVWIDQFFAVNNGGNPAYLLVTPQATTVTNELVAYRVTADLTGGWWQILDTSAQAMVSVLDVTGPPAVKALELQYGTSLGVWSGSDEGIAKFYVTASSGNVNTQGTLYVGGNATFNAAATVYEKLTAAKGTGTGLDVTSNATVGGTLGVTGNATLNGTINTVVPSANGTQTFRVDNTAGTGVFRVDTTNNRVTVRNGNTFYVYSGDSVGTATFSVAGATGNTTVAGTLGVTGDVAVNTDKFNVTASSGNTSVAGTLGVTGAATFDGNVTLGNAAGDTITVTGTPTFAEAVTLNKTLTVTGTTNLNGTVNLGDGTDTVELQAGKLRTSGTAPAWDIAANNNGIGTAANGASVTPDADCTNVAGRVQVVTASTVTWSTTNNRVAYCPFADSITMSGNYVVLLSPGNNTTALAWSSVGFYVATRNSTGFYIQAGAAPATSTTYVFYYTVIDIVA